MPSSRRQRGIAGLWVKAAGGAVALHPSLRRGILVCLVSARLGSGLGQRQRLRPTLGAGLWDGTTLWAEPSPEGRVVGGHPFLDGTEGGAVAGYRIWGAVLESQPEGGQRLGPGAGIRRGWGLGRRAGEWEKISFRDVGEGGAFRGFPRLYR